MDISKRSKKFGDKSYLRCAINYHCNSGIYLLYNNDNDEKISVFRNDIDHDHSQKKDNQWGIKKDIQEEIKLIYKQGTKTPLNIIYELRERNIEEPLIDKICQNGSKWLRDGRKIV